MSTQLYPFTDTPGPSAVTTASQRKIVRGYPSSLILIGILIDKNSTDSTNTVTTELREGLILGKITATGKYKQYDPTATDGSQFPVCVLYEARKMVDAAGTTRDQTAQGIIAGFVIGSQCINLDSRVRQSLPEVIFDDLLPGEMQGAWAGPVAKTADYTVVAADSGKTFTNLGAGGAVNFTLPATIKAGFRARFFCEAGQTITVTAPSGKLVAFNNAAATSIAFSTASEKIGGCVEIVSNSDQSKYLAIVSLGTETQTPVIA